jgi:hypothetical protein
MPSPHRTSAAPPPLCCPLQKERKSRLLCREVRLRSASKHLAPTGLQRYNEAFRFHHFRGTGIIYMIDQARLQPLWRRRSVCSVR